MFGRGITLYGPIGSYAKFVLLTKTQSYFFHKKLTSKD